MNRSNSYFAFLLASAAMLAVAESNADAASMSKPEWTDQYQVGYFTVLSAQPPRRGAVTCTDSTVFGSIASSGAMPSVVLTRCPVSGHVVSPVSNTVLAQFNQEFVRVGNRQCEHILTGTQAGAILHPGVYCFSASAALTGTLTLDGPVNGTWVFLVNGALTGKSFSTRMAGNAKPCGVTWESVGATTMTSSDVKGNIFAGQAITLTGGTIVGRAFAKKAVTMTNVAVTGCQ